MNTKQFKTKCEIRQERRVKRGRQCIELIISRSQVLFWVGLLGIIGEMLYLYATKDVAIVYSGWQQALLYGIGVISILLFVLGLVVFNKLCSIDNNSKRRERR